MRLSRREVLKHCIASLALSVIPLPLSGAQPRGTVATRLYLVGSENHACVFMFDGNTLSLRQHIDIGFKPHSFLQHPTRVERIWTIQRYDTPDITTKESALYRAVEFDLLNGEITNEIRAAAGSKFRGHGFFAPDSHTLFLSRINSEQEEGYLTGYDIASGSPRVIADYRIGKTWLHEAILDEDGNALVATAGLATRMEEWEGALAKGVMGSGVACVELSNGRIRSHMRLDSDLHMASHLVQTQSGLIVAVGRSLAGSSLSGAIFTGRPGDAKLATVAIAGEAALEGEKFGIAVNNEDNSVAVTDYEHKTITVLEAVTGKFLRTVGQEGALGISYDAATRSYISNGNGLVVFDHHMTKRLNVAETPDTGKMYNVGHSLFLPA